MDEIQLWTSGPDYFETTKVPFGAFTTEEIVFDGFTTPQPEIDLSTVMTFPTDAPSIFTTAPIFDFTTLPDLVTLGVTEQVTDGLPPLVPETTEFVPFETTAPPMIIDFTTPFQQTPTVPEWLFQTTANFDLQEITEDFTGLPFLTTPQPGTPEKTKAVEKPNPNPDAFDQDAFTNAIENAIKALENQNSSDGESDETGKTDEDPIIDENSVAVLIPVPNKSTTSSPVITSTSTTVTSTSTSTTSNASTSMTVAPSTTTNIRTSTSSSTSQTSTITSTTPMATTGVFTTAGSITSVPSSDTTVVVETIPFTTAEDESMLTNTPTTETDTTVSGVDIDVTTPVDLVIDLSTKDIDTTGNACIIIYNPYLMGHII